MIDDFDLLLEHERSKVGTEPWERLSDNDPEKKGMYRASKKYSILKELVRRKQGGVCDHCGLSGDGLHLHHNNYTRYFNERIGDVALVHPSCHTRHHFRDAQETNSKTTLTSEDFMKELESKSVGVTPPILSVAAKAICAFMRTVNTSSVYKTADLNKFACKQNPAVDEDKLFKAISTVVSRMRHMGLFVSTGPYEFIVTKEAKTTFGENPELFREMLTQIEKAGKYKGADPRIEWVGCDKVKLDCRIFVPELKEFLTTTCNLNYDILVARRQQNQAFVPKYNLKVENTEETDGATLFPSQKPDLMPLPMPRSVNRFSPGTKKAKDIAKDIAKMRQKAKEDFLNEEYEKTINQYRLQAAHV